MSTQAKPPKPPPKTTTKPLTCLCGTVALTITGVDKGTVLCHCSNCQKFTGAPFAHNYRILNADIRVRKGEGSLKAYHDTATKSGGTLLRRFCGECGSPLYAQPLAIKGMVVIPTSAASDRTPPSFELFPENKHEWVGNLTSKAKM